MANTDEQGTVAASRPVVLTGRFEHALDPKKRLTVPACWREQVKPYVFVAPSRVEGENCLTLIPAAEMELQLEALRKKPLFDKQARAQLRVFENIEQCVLDSQGRIRINDDLLKFAGLADGVVLKGALRMAELWSASKGGESGGIVPVDEDLEDAGL